LTYYWSNLREELVELARAATEGIVLIEGAESNQAREACAGAQRTILVDDIGIELRRIEWL